MLRMKAVKLSAHHVGCTMLYFIDCCQIDCVNLLRCCRILLNLMYFLFRFLVYNNVGIVKSHESDTERSLDIEFHDIAVHHALHLANHDQFSLAALSSSVLALASTGDGESGSKLSVNYFSSSDLNKAGLQVHS